MLKRLPELRTAGLDGSTGRWRVLAAVACCVALLAGVVTTSAAGASTVEAALRPPRPGAAAQGRAAAAVATGSSFVTRSGSQLLVNGAPFRFAGTNMYWLVLDDNTPTVSYPTHFEIDDAMKTAAAMGETVVRAWADTVGCALCIEPSPGVFNASAMASLDYAVASARRHGLRLILTLVDNWAYYNGGKNTFTAWAGQPESAFFTDPTVIGEYETFIAHVVSHVDPYSGLAYNQDPTIMAWETGNEVWCQTCGGGSVQEGAEASWTNAIASYIKSQAPQQLVVDGLGVSASCTSGCLNAQALASPAVDIVDDHFYPMDVERLDADSAQAQAASRAYVVGEYDWDNYESGGDPLPAFLAAAQADPVAGDLLWVLIPHDSGGGFQDHNDGFQFMLAASSPDMITRVGELRDHAYAMQGVNPPAPAPPGQPEILEALPSAGSVAITWRGAAGAMSYRIQRLGSGGWSNVASDVTDPVNTGSTPVGWTDNAPLAGTDEYRIAAVNLAGATGRWSAPLAASLGAHRTG